MQDFKGKRIAAYARTSTDKQQATSIPDQLRLCREYAERRGGTLVEALAFSDGAKSGSTASRPGLDRLKAALCRGQVDVILTEDLSRIGRSTGNNDQLLKQIRAYGVRFIAISDGLDTGCSLEG